MTDRSTPHVPALSVDRALRTTDLLSRFQLGVGSSAKKKVSVFVPTEIEDLRPRSVVPANGMPRSATVLAKSQRMVAIWP